MLGENVNELSFEDKMVKLVDCIVNQLNSNQSLLTFISKNLSWGIFKSALTSPSSNDDVDFSEVYYNMIKEAPYDLKDPEIMLFMIIELVSSTCYSTILYNEPCSLENLKPYLFATIRTMIAQHKAV